ncbi:MAG: 30S ribosomal protein S16 [Verrucomicrobia bacterium]|nr:30S ribosomal protein S16 [Verrucomicrobiota bacterium]
MALKIRLQRHGASHRPFYRMVVTEAAARRDGRFVEVLGTYEPQANKPENQLLLKLERIDYWKSVGAKPSDTAASLIRRARRGHVDPPIEAPKPKAKPAPEPEVIEEVTEEAPAEEAAAVEEVVEAEAAPADVEAAAEATPAEETTGAAPAGPDCACGKMEDANGKCDGSHSKKEEPKAEATEESTESKEEAS